MSPEILIAFITATVALAFLPGPAIALFVTTSTVHGPRAGVLAWAGNTLGLVIMVTLAGLGIAPLLKMAAQWIEVIRVIGALYLMWLGLGMIRKGLAARNAADAPAAQLKDGRYFLSGLFTSMSNPKVFLFLGAFFPQFIDPAAPITPQVIVLGITWIAVLAVADLAIVLASSYARRWLLGRRGITEMGAGALLIAVGVGMGLARR